MTWPSALITRPPRAKGAEQKCAKTTNGLQSLRADVDLGSRAAEFDRRSSRTRYGTRDASTDIRETEAARGLVRASRATSCAEAPRSLARLRPRTCVGLDLEKKLPSRLVSSTTMRKALADARAPMQRGARAPRARARRPTRLVPVARRASRSRARSRARWRSRRVSRVAAWTLRRRAGQDLRAQGAGGINCLELDETERRYLLVGTVDAGRRRLRRGQPERWTQTPATRGTGVSTDRSRPPSRTGPTTTEGERGVQEPRLVPSLCAPPPLTALASPVAPLFRP